MTGLIHDAVNVTWINKYSWNRRAKSFIRLRKK